MTDTAVGRTGRPGKVEAAFRLSLAAIAAQAVVWVLGTFAVAPTGFGEMRDEMGRDGAVVQAAVSGGFLVVLSALWLLLALRTRAGAGWARIALTALGVLFLLTGLGTDGFRWSSAAGGTGGLLPHDLLPDLLAAGAIVLMFLPASNAYFSAAPRAGR